MRSYLKKVFWPNLPALGGNGASFQVLDILEYARGLTLGPALILNQNLIFEMASSTTQKSVSYERLLPLPVWGMKGWIKEAETQSYSDQLEFPPRSQVLLDFHRSIIVVAQLKKQQLIPYASEQGGYNVEDLKRSPHPAHGVKIVLSDFGR